MTGTEMTIVRHGLAWINLERKATGGSCRGLTPDGAAQVELLAERFVASAADGHGFDAAYHSTRTRCEQTAAIIADRTGLHIQAYADLRNADHGHAGIDPWDFTTNSIGTIPPLAPESAPAPGAESWQHHLDRVGAALLAIAARHAGQRVLVVAHSETTSAALYAFAGMPAGASRRCYAETPHTALTRWLHHVPAFPGAPADGVWTLLSHGDDRHLQ